jgi:hypothetical protein
VGQGGNAYKNVTKLHEGMVSLHHACAGNALNSLEHVMALFDASINGCLTIHDHQGRTPFQLLPHKASIMNENEMHLSHCLVSRSKRLSMKSLHLLIDAYPESITLADKYGMIPFHYA